MVNSVSVSWLLPSLQLKVHSESQAQRNPLALTAELFNHLSAGPGPWISVNKHSIEIISSLLCSAVSFFHTLALLSFPLLLSPYPFFLFSSPQCHCVMELYVLFCSTCPNSLTAPPRAYTVTKPRSWFWLLWDYWWAWSPMFLSAHHLYQAHLFHIMQSTLSSTPVPHHAINSPIKASSTFQSPPDRCTTQYEYMPANLCPEVFVFCQFLRNWELTRFSLSWLQKSSLNLWLRSLTRTLEHRVLEPGPQTLYPTRAFTTQFTSLFVLVVNKLTLIVL